MPRTRQELERIEREILAPCAQKCSDTRGRKYEEPPPVWRTEYQRDRDRVIHSRAFRRLEYLYFNPGVHEPNQRAVRMLEELFHFYFKQPREVGEQARKRARKVGPHRAVCDYLAGMTDRYVMLEYQRLFGGTA